MEMLLMGIALVPLFAAVTCSGADVVPTSTSPKLTMDGARLTAPAADPVPVKSTVSSPPYTLAKMVISPESGPVACGVNVTWMAQVAPAVTAVFTQLSVSVKFPLIEMDVGVNARLPVFSSVTVSGLLAVPKTWLGKVSEAGLAAAAVKAVPALHSGVCQMPRP